MDANSAYSFNSLLDNKVWNVSCTVLNWIYLYSSFNFTAELFFFRSILTFWTLWKPESPSPCDVPPVSPFRTLKAQQTSLSTHPSAYIIGLPVGPQPLSRHGGSLSITGSIPIENNVSRKATVAVTVKADQLPASEPYQNQEHGELYTCQSGCKRANTASGRAF